MLNFKVLEELEPNSKLINAISNFKYKVIKGKVKVLLNTNLKFIEPTIYEISSPITLTIYEYKISEISNRPFFIKEHKNKYNLTEIMSILKKF